MQKESTLHLVLRLRGGMQIFVKILTETRTITLEDEPSDHITRSWNEVTVKKPKKKSLSIDNSL